jgi:hypothetical protein
MNVRTGPFLAALTLVLAASGCNSRLVTVTGTLTYKGQPVPSTRVKFFPDDGSRRATGLTDDNGKFSLRYSRTEAGATRGPCTVVLTYEVSNEEELGSIPPRASPELKAVIGKYGNLKTSPLHYEITHSGQSFAIDLE